MLNQSIKFFTIFLLVFNVFAGGDDRDEEYYENLDEELASFEAQLAEDFSNQAALEEFQAKLAKEKAAAARSTEIYQARVQQEQMIKDRQAQLALERELAAFEAQLEEDLAKQSAKKAFDEWYSEFLARKAAQEALEKELAAFEAQLEADLARQAADEALEKELAAFEAQLEAELAAEDMMAEIIAEEERAKRLAEFQAKLEAEKAAAAASTAAYQAKVAEEKAAAAELAAFKAELAAHEECKDALNLSDSNITLFKTALVTGNLFNVGPQITTGTEFSANRWDDYASCIGALGYTNPF